LGVETEKLIRPFFNATLEIFVRPLERIFCDSLFGNVFRVSDRRVMFIFFISQGDDAAANQANLTVWANDSILKSLFLFAGSVRFDHIKYRSTVLVINALEPATGEV